MAGREAALPGYAPLRRPEVESYLNHGTGIRSWIFTLDHKRIGILYLVSVLTAFLAGGIAALLVRTELLTPGQTIMGPDTYNQMFTLHGVIMVFLFMIPAIPGSLGNFILPMMLGAKDVAFPRLNLMSWWLYVSGALCALISIVTGGVDTGWTFYTPYSTTTSGNVVAMVFGAFLLGFSSIFTGLNFIVTMHKLRPQGMSWFRMPLFPWALYATSIIQILATPVLGITLLLLIAERTLHVGIFDPALGGDPVLYQHFFWFYSHPAVYIMILPAMGIISEVIAVFSRKHIFGYKFIAFSSIAIALFGFLVWGHHLFTSGQSDLGNMVFSALTFSVAIPSAIKVWNWLATMYKGAIHLDTPMLYALAFIFLFTIGGLTGMFVAMVAVDTHLHDTYFVVAHFHYVMFGGTITAFLAGLHYWWPKMTGKMYSERWGRIAWTFIFVGFQVTFFTQFIMGAKGMPRRYWSYLPQFQPYHVTSTIGSYIMGAGFFIVAGLLLHSLYRGRRAGPNPWGAATLEWETNSPPPWDNFSETPVVGDPYDLDAFQPEPEKATWVRTLPKDRLAEHHG